MLVLLAFVTAFSFGSLASAQDNTLVIGWEQEPPLLNPRSDLAFAVLMQPFYARGLWDWDLERNIFPVMAAEIPTLDNGRVTTLENGNTQVTISLREGLLWSDGEAITVDDCLFWHEILMDPTKGTIQRTSYPEVVESLEKVDDLTMVVTYNRPWPDFQSQAVPVCSYPEHVLGPSLEADGTIDNAPYFSGQGVVGYGPYVLSEWVVGDSMTFDVNPTWDGAAPGFNRVVLRFITETAQMQNAMQAGEIDVAFNWSDDQVAAYSAIEGTEVFSTPGVFGDAVWMNLGNGGNPALADINVRRAIIHATDRAAMAEALVGPGIEVPRSWYPEQFWPAESDLPLVEYNVDGARELLTAAGWIDDNGDETDENTEDTPTPRIAQDVAGVADGTPLILRFFTTTRQVRIDYQLLIQGYLNEVGISTQLLPVPATILFAGFLERGILTTGDFDMAIFALSSNPLSPFADAPTWFGCDNIPSAEDPNGNNGWGVCSPEFDALDLEVGSTLDPAERLAKAQEAQEALFGQQFWHGLYLRPTWYAINTARVTVDDNVRNVGTLSGNYFNQIELWQPAG